ncbi:MAG: type II secretion system F family protein [Pirellulaceae bacterium]|nr:type II secretion system F family protein [Pirellulaceae bacterium]
MSAEAISLLPAEVIWSSLLMAGATYLAIHFLLKLVFDLDNCRLEQWHREEPRWNCLRQVSGLFKSFQPWIVGLSRLVDKYLAFMMKTDKPTSHGQRAVQLFVRLVFGDPARMQSANRALHAVEPWSVSERLACGFAFSTLAGLFAVFVLVDSTITYRGYLLIVATWFAAFRLWRGAVVSRGERRRRAVRRFLPHAMDCIATVMSSGDTFRTGIETVIRDFPDHPLCQDLQRLRNELDRGQVMATALQSTAESIGLPEFDEMVRVLARIHQHGTPASDSFVRLAKQLRVSHLRHMEEEVGRAEASMALPTMLVMASCMIVAAAPFVLSIMESSMFQ